MHDPRCACDEYSRNDLIAELTRRASLSRPTLCLPPEREREDGDVLRKNSAYICREDACAALSIGDRETAVEMIRRLETTYFDLKDSAESMSVLEQSLFYVIDRAIAARAEDVVLDGLKFALRAETPWESQGKVSPLLAWNIANAIIECMKVGFSDTVAYGIRGLCEVYASFVYCRVGHNDAPDPQQAEYALIGLPNVLRRILSEAARLKRRDIVDFAIVQYGLTIRNIANFGQASLLTTTLRPWATYFGQLAGELMKGNLIDAYAANPFSSDVWNRCEDSASICIDTCGDALRDLAAGGSLPSNWARDYAELGRQLIEKRATGVSGWPKADQLAIKLIDQLGSIAAAIKDQEYARKVVEDGFRSMLSASGDEKALKDIKDHIHKAQEAPKKGVDSSKANGLRACKKA